MDAHNGFLVSSQLTDLANTVLSTTTYESTTTPDAGGLDGSLSRVKSATTSRLNGNTRAVRYAYTDAACLQVSTTTSQVQVGGAFKTYQTAGVDRYNDKSSILAFGQAAQATTTRWAVGTAAALSPVRIINNTWDTGNLLQLQNTFVSPVAGSASPLQHGQTYTYTRDGKLATQGTFHIENGQTLAAPPSMLWDQTQSTYDATTGRLAAVSTAYQDAEAPSGLGTLGRSFTLPDAQGNPTLLVDEKGVSTTVSFDLFGRKLTSHTPSLADTTWQYPDPWTVTTIRSGRTQTGYLDGFGRLVAEDLADGTHVQYRFDGHGRLAETRMISRTGTPKTCSTTYDLLDRPLSQTSYDGIVTRFEYAALGNGDDQVTRSCNGLYPTVTETDPLGQVVQVTAPTGEVTAKAYDGLGDLVSINTAPVAGGHQLRIFQFDGLGRLISKLEPETGNQTFQSFNALNQAQLVTEASSRHRTRGFDGLGRLRSQTSGAITETFTCTGPFLTRTRRSVNGDQVTQTFQYNGPGAQLSQETSGGSVTGAW